MNINAQITLTQADEWSITVEEAASAILTALGGDPSKDTCFVTANSTATVGGPQPTMAPPQPPQPQPPAE